MLRSNVNMRLAIMQPYFFPYVGYWQLIHAVDRFVIYDDVTYIKGGWINRNRILINGAPCFINVPLQQSSSYKRICDTSILSAPEWRDKLIKMIALAYRKAPFFDDVFPLIESLIRHDANNLSDYLLHQLQSLAAYLGINTEIVASSRHYQNASLSGQERVIDICKREKASIYINPQGGQALYNANVFRTDNLDLRFIIMRPIPYRQRVEGFVSCLSIIDALMEIGPIGMKQQLDSFDLISSASH